MGAAAEQMVYVLEATRLDIGKGYAVSGTGVIQNLKPMDRGSFW